MHPRCSDSSIASGPDPKPGPGVVGMGNGLIRPAAGQPGCAGGIYPGRRQLAFALRQGSQHSTTEVYLMPSSKSDALTPNAIAMSPSRS